MSVYIAPRQTTVAQYISIRPMMEIFLDAAAQPGACVVNRWWEEYRVVLAEAWVSAYEGIMDVLDYGATERP